MKAYSFMDVLCTLAGPGGSVDFGQGAGAAEEGITFSPNGDKNTMTIGAGGEGMHSLHADQSGTITVRLLKRSPSNAVLSRMYALQTASSALHGQNVVSLKDNASNDSVSALQVAFKKRPDLNFAKDGGIVEWQFDAVVMSFLFSY